MKKALKWIIGILCTLVVLVVGVLATAFYVFHTEWFQDELKERVVEQLTEKLDTRIELDHIGIDLMTFDAKIQGLSVEDRQQRKMLQLDHLQVDFNVLNYLMHKEIYVREATVRGLEANLLQESPDSAANFQFVIDAFKRDKKHNEKVDSLKHKPKLTFKVKKVTLESIKVRFNDKRAHLGRFVYKSGGNGRDVAEINELRAQWVSKSKKGPVDNTLRVKVIDMHDTKQGKKLTIDSLCFTTDNHKQRVNVGKPKHGAFDAGHLNVVAQMYLNIEHLEKDSFVAVVTNGQAIDRGSGLDVHKLNLRVAGNKRSLHLSNVTVALANTVLKFDDADVQLPSKKEGRQLSYSTSMITGRTQLRDISKPFAPVLAKFTLPLNLQTRMSGDADGMQFRSVTVYTDDKQLTIHAGGSISGLKDKYKLHVHFNVSRMTAFGGSKEKIINQFTVKKFMMKQLHNLGRIDYTGYFDVVWKRETFVGKLNTAVGGLNFQFSLDEKNKYLTGTAVTDSLELGKAMDMPELGKVAAKADFMFDISKPRTALMRKRLGGKLPIGRVDAQVNEASYRFVKTHNTEVHIESNGAVAEGRVNMRGRYIDVVCSFSFTNTNDMKKMKIKPGLKFHKAHDEDNLTKEERRDRRKLLREERKATRAEQKAAKKEAKAIIKEQKAAEKAARDAEKAAEKAAKKEAKAAEKAAKKEAKAAEKERKAAEKAARKAAKNL